MHLDRNTLRGCYDFRYSFSLLNTFTQYFQDEYKSLLYARDENRGTHGDVIVYILAHLHTALYTEENMLDIN